MQGKKTKPPKYEEKATMALKLQDVFNFLSIAFLISWYEVVPVILLIKMFHVY